MPKLSNQPERFYLGIDPGTNGAAVLLDQYLKPAVGIGPSWYCRFDQATEHDISLWMGTVIELIRVRKQPTEIMAAIEAVHSMPKQGVSSSFKFGMVYGFMRGILVGHAVPFINPSPQKWQGIMGCRSKGNKNVTKQRAQQLWPSYAKDINHKTADAMLIAASIVKLI